MCGRYAFFTIKGLQEKFNIPESTLSLIAPCYNISPYTDVCAIADRTVKAMYWQLIPSFSHEFKSAYSMFNTRIESFSESKYKKELLLETRCIIPADNYYEWEKTGKTKVPYLFRKSDKSLMYFAGIYTTWRDNQTRSERLSCSIITKEADKSFSDIHNRMPVMLTDEQLEEWLHPDVLYSRLNSIMESSPADQIEFYQVSNKVNKVENNSPELLIPA